ncbi:MAG: UDP-N-acetylmuramoyl-tripeptide--D-alanyl-D-alanine ligase [Deltaproteobacteria bacterium]|nr:UDP-N-acetylmuramoyl-tripeptide--D-alanyl-D-alanine ligase [Deltaproteobacteria bacterium]
MDWSIEELAQAAGGTIVQRGAALRVGEVCTDSRRVERNGVFVALRGEVHDGHAFVPEAARRGSGCVIVQGNVALAREVAVIRVRDTLRALGDVAHYHRRRLAPRVLAITGSNGKTTTKEMLFSILQRARLDDRPLRGRVLKTEGNYNNLVGLPLTLLRLRGRERAAVVELGTNRPGEIRRLTAIAEPDVAVITSVAPAHLSGLKTVAGVAREKGAIFRGLGAHGTAVVNLDDARVARQSRAFQGRVVTYGTGGQVRGEDPEMLVGGRLRFNLRVGRVREPVRLRLCGLHNVRNAVGAAAMAHAFGVDVTAIRKGLEAVRPVSMRMEVERWRGIGIINDAYNANPASMEAALAALRAIPSRGRRVAVLGDMLEMGENESACHREVGETAARSGLDTLYVMGRFAREIRRGAVGAGMEPSAVRVARAHQPLGEELRGVLRKGDWVLVKGSRGAAMEQVLAAMKDGGA